MGKSVTFPRALATPPPKFFPEIGQVRLPSRYTFTRDYSLRLCSCQSVLGNLHLRVTAQANWNPPPDNRDIAGSYLCQSRDLAAIWRRLGPGEGGEGD